MKAYYVVDNCGEIEKSNTIELDNLSKEDLSVYAMGLMFDSGYTNQIPFAIYINDGSGYECYETNNANLEEKIYESFQTNPHTLRKGFKTQWAGAKLRRRRRGRYVIQHRWAKPNCAACT